MFRATCRRTPADPDCERCDGLGEILIHSAWCADPLCVLVGGVWGCDGVLVPCPVCRPDDAPQGGW